MNLLDLVHRPANPAPWSEGDNIPWNEPEFSQRMLAEHLSQEHHAASRKLDKVQRQLQWIHQQVLGGRPGRVLDLGCGPGLYSSELARRGHSCVGIDFSPASIAYARQTAAEAGLNCTYQLADLREAEYGQGYDLAMQIYGELNVFSPQHARQILAKAYAALRPGGKLLLEPHVDASIRALGNQSPKWWTQTSGLFSPRPHVVLQESFWDEGSQTATIRYYVIDAQTGTLTRLAQSLQAYSPDEYETLLTGCGFRSVSFYPSLEGGLDESQPDLFAITAEKPLGEEAE